MADKYFASFRLIVTVEFTDDGVNDLRDQAHEALLEASLNPNEQDAELIGSPEKCRAALSAKQEVE